MMKVLISGATSRNPDGTFKRVRKQFSLDNFNDGYVDADGRFRVWMPDNPRSYKEGYILRSIAAYELYHNIQVPFDYDIHHIDGNRLNDSKNNLELVNHKVHGINHNIQKKANAQITRKCLTCGNEFSFARFRLRDHPKKFCSFRCYNVYRRRSVK